MRGVATFFAEVRRVRDVRIVQLQTSSSILQSLMQLAFLSNYNVLALDLLP